MTLKIVGRKVAGESRENAEKVLRSWQKSINEVTSMDEETVQDAIAVEVQTTCRLDVINRLCGRLNAIRATEVTQEVRKALATVPVETPKARKPKKEKNATAKDKELDVLDLISPSKKEEEVA